MGTHSVEELEDEVVSSSPVVSWESCSLNIVSIFIYCDSPLDHLPHPTTACWRRETQTRSSSLTELGTAQSGLVSRDGQQPGRGHLVPLTPCPRSSGCLGSDITQRFFQDLGSHVLYLFHHSLSGGTRDGAISYSINWCVKHRWHILPQPFSCIPSLGLNSCPSPMILERKILPSSVRKG